jgi:hypothetical protein
MDPDMNHYLLATTQAARRARGTILVLITASILVLASLLNSSKSEWTRQRLLLIGRDPYGHYVSSLIGDRQGLGGEEERNKRYAVLYAAALHDYIDNAWTVHVPQFGFSFDINDLGSVAGAGFIVLLSMLLFSLKRELSNLVTSFGAAERQNELKIFYELLAMDQVLTVPEGLHGPRSWYSRVVPKIILCVPAAVYMCVVSLDLPYIFTGNFISSRRIYFLFGCEAAFGLLILWLTWSVVSAVREIDSTWKGAFSKLEHIGTSPLPSKKISRSASRRTPYCRSL